MSLALGIFAVFALVWAPPVAVGAIYGRRVPTRDRAFLRAGVIAYGVGGLFALGYVAVLFLLGVVSFGKPPAGDILFLVVMWGVVPGIMGGLVAYVSWKPLPNSHSPLARNLSWQPAADLLPARREQVKDAIRGVCPEMRE